MAESVISSFKNEEIGQNGPWKKCSDVELATLTWVDWYNRSRLEVSAARRVRGELPEGVSFPMKTVSNFPGMDQSSLG